MAKCKKKADIGLLAYSRIVYYAFASTLPGFFESKQTLYFSLLGILSAIASLHLLLTLFDAFTQGDWCYFIHKDSLICIFLLILTGVLHTQYARKSTSG